MRQAAIPAQSWIGYSAVLDTLSPLTLQTARKLHAVHALPVYVDSIVITTEPGRQMTSYTAYIQKLLGDTEWFKSGCNCLVSPRSKRLEKICSRLLRSRMMMMTTTELGLCWKYTRPEIASIVFSSYHSDHLTTECPPPPPPCPLSPHLPTHHLQSTMTSVRLSVKTVIRIDTSPGEDSTKLSRGCAGHDFYDDGGGREFRIQIRTWKLIKSDFYSGCLPVYIFWFLVFVSSCAKGDFQSLFCPSIMPVNLYLCPNC